MLKDINIRKMNVITKLLCMLQADPGVVKSRNVRKMEIGIYKYKFQEYPDIIKNIS